MDTNPRVELDDPLRPLSDVYKPDDRQANLVQSLEDVHEFLSGLVLRQDVPIDIRQMFETAKNARLYTYFVFRFHQLVEMMAYQTLERALKIRWNAEVARLDNIEDPSYRWPGLADLLEHAVLYRWIRNEGFSSREYRAFNRLSSQRAMMAVSAMTASGVQALSFAEPTQAQIEEIARQVDVASLMKDLVAEFRNQLAHGSPRLSPTSNLVLQDVCDAVNMIFDGTPSTPPPPSSAPSKPAGLHKQFQKHLTFLEETRRELMRMQPVTRESLPRKMPARGVYMFSEAGRHLYVGRSNTLRKRIGRHCRPSAKHNMASFAYRLAAEKCGIGKATYKAGDGRKEMCEREDMKLEFAAAKVRIRKMHLRFIEEIDPVRQMLLEAYVATVHMTPYNDFDNH